MCRKAVKLDINAWAWQKFHSPVRVVLQERVHGMLKRQSTSHFKPSIWKQTHTLENKNCTRWTRNRERVIVQSRTHNPWNQYSTVAKHNELTWPDGVPHPDPRAGAALSVGERCGQRKRPRNRLCAKNSVYPPAHGCWVLGLSKWPTLVFFFRGVKMSAWHLRSEGRGFATCRNSVIGWWAWGIREVSVK